MVSIGPIARPPVAVQDAHSAEPTPSTASERLSVSRVSKIEDFVATHTHPTTPEVLPVSYVIYSDSESADGDPLFWSNDDGWVSFQTATRFTPQERFTVTLPMASGGDAQWVTLADAMAFVRAREGD